VIPELERHPINTSWLQFPSFGGRRWRYLLPLMPAAIENFNFPDADLVISSSHCVAKGVIPPPGAFHLSYIHTPMRYVWDQRALYLKRIPRILHPIIQSRLARLRQWDMVSSARVDRLIANSRLVAWRIKHYWNRPAEVIPPPVDVEFFTPGGERGANLLTVAALVPYKRVEVAIEVAKRLGRTIEIVGTGPQMGLLRRIAGDHVRFLGWLSREDLREAYRRAAALLVPNIEDFGMVTVEALGCGTPAVGLAASGTADVLRSGQEGELAEDSTIEALEEATAQTLAKPWDMASLRERAQVFSRDRFQMRFRFLLDRLGFGRVLG
jgi:glycosyltransferase involved in cell wall biosynthesis